ncbi:hypothetical protein PCASD_16610 [Puccinia coronata f. sp. avenae]|uniref:Uncharacterized protein n=1 Tax=Puccinia coronata f. sp. avenae TaxID=200324 RepID=A0A2N5T194_9BASI|nr:hypothetical protein PCASD_16610 [Puccinia coronata f. sp. avenae]
MTDRVSHPNLPTLTNLNWVLWKISIEGYMKQHDLYLFISSDDPIPANNAEAKIFKTKKMKASGVVFHSRSNAKEVHFIYYKFTYRMYTRTGYKRRNIREEYRRNPEEYTIHQHHRINNKEELHQQQAGNTDDGSSTRSGHRGKKGKKDQEEERPKP